MYLLSLLAAYADVLQGNVDPEHQLDQLCVDDPQNTDGDQSATCKLSGKLYALKYHGIIIVHMYEH